MPFDFAEALTGMVQGVLPGAVSAMIPRSVTETIKARIERANPFATISGNHDLVRAVRLAWIRAAEVIIDATRKAADLPEFDADKQIIAEFGREADRRLNAIRAEALNRGGDPGSTPIDTHVFAVLGGTPEFASPSQRVKVGTPLSEGFVTTICALTNWVEPDVPRLFGRIAEDGVTDAGSSVRRSFGDLVFAEFAEILKDPDRYPHANPAFQIYMSGAIKDLAQETLAATKGIDEKLDAALAQLSALNLIGASKYLTLLPQLAENVDRLSHQVAEIERRHADESSRLERRLVITIARLVNRDVADFDAAIGEIEQHMQRVADAIARGDTLSNSDDVLRVLRTSIAADLRAGDLDAPSRRVDDALAEQAKVIADFEAAQRKTTIALLDEGIAVDLLRRDAEGVARRVVAKVDLDRPEADARYNQLHDLAGRWFLEANLRHGVLGAQIGAAIARQAATTAQGVNRLNASALEAAALVIVGQHGGGVAPLERALELLQSVAGSKVLKRQPNAMADLHVKLAAVLTLLGSATRRTMHQYRALEHLNEALRVYDKTIDASDWVSAQTAKAEVLAALANHEGSAARRKDSMAARRAAADAAIGNPGVNRQVAIGAVTNLAAALLRAGEEGADVGVFEEALSLTTGLDIANEEVEFPLIWASRRALRGQIYLRWGEAARDASKFGSAVADLRVALGIITRDLDPESWAYAHRYLSEALLQLVLHGGDQSSLAEARDSAEIAVAHFEERADTKRVGEASTILERIAQAQAA